MSSQLKTLIEATGLPADKLLTQRQSLPEPVQRLHQRTLLTLGRSGEPPPRGQLQAWTNELQLDLDTSLQQLAAAELLFLDPSGRQITGGRDVDVQSLDPLTADQVTASCRGGHWAWQPAEAVVFVGSSGQGRITETCCPVINFFTTSEHARAYQHTHALDGVVVTMSDAIEAGTLVFGDLLHQPADPT